MSSEKRKRKHHIRSRVSKARRFSTFLADQNQCVYCGNSDTPTLDHIVPVASRANEWPIHIINHEKNLVTACFWCNQQRKALQDALVLQYGRFTGKPVKFHVYRMHVTRELTVLARPWLTLMEGGIYVQCTSDSSYRNGARFARQGG
jgi:hypothetical protein